MAVSAAAALLGGCAGLTGPVKSARPPTPAERLKAAREEAIDNARRALAQAKSAGGEFAAPYEFYLADEYLDLAVKEAREGDKHGVIVFAEQSAAYSRDAIRAAGGERR